MKTYCIIGTTQNEKCPITDEMLRWSSVDGWVSECFNLFNENELDKTYLPIGGKWELFFDNES